MRELNKFGSGMKQGIRAKGKVIIFKKENGVILYENDNLVVDTGLSILRDMFAGGNAPAYCAIGDDTTPVASTDTALGNELFRKAITDTDTPAYNVIRIDTEIFATEAVFNWKEVGLFRDASAGPMFNRVLVDFNKISGDTVIVRFEITFTAV